MKIKLINANTQGVSQLNNNQLKQFYEKCQKDKLIAIDTEFYRVDTYYPILCLIQLANTTETILLDPIVNKIDFTPLGKVLNNTKIKKIFHAARQDVEIFFNIFRKIPKPVVDTQICLLAVGYENSVSYAKACEDILKVKINKNKQFIDWRRRPLSKEKRNYAINDVKHLIPLYKKINNVKDENYDLSKYYKKILNKNIFTHKIENAWKKIKFAPTNDKELQNIKKFSRIREKIAMMKDIPIQRVLSDKEIRIISREKNKSKYKKLLKKLNLT